MVLLCSDVMMVEAFVFKIDLLKRGLDLFSAKYNVALEVALIFGHIFVVTFIFQYFLVHCVEHITIQWSKLTSTKCT